MFDFLKRKKNPDEPQEISPLIAKETKPITWVSRLKQGLAKTRAGFTTGIANLFLGKKELNQALIDEIEMALLTADVGIETTEQLIKTLTAKLQRKELNDSQAAFQCLQQEMKKILQTCSLPLSIPDEIKPFVILVIGVNGSGKTTTIGKLAHYFKQMNKHVLLAAGDTFRAAAIEQLQVWGSRNEIPVIAQQPGADTAAVIYDAMASFASTRGGYINC